MAPYLTCDQEGAGQGTLLVLCDPGAVLPLPRASVSTLRKKGVVGKETMRSDQNIPHCSALWVGTFLDSHLSFSKAAPSPRPHPAQGLLSGGLEAPLGPREQSR